MESFIEIMRIGNAQIIIKYILDLFIDNFSFIAFIIFTLLAILRAKLSHWCYLFYKSFLLWFQTFNLRNGKNPFQFIIDKSGFTIVKKYLKGEVDKHYEVKRQSKGLVGVLEENLKDVLNANIGTNDIGLNEIFFADKDGDYYNRNTNIDKGIIKEQCEKIQRYYDAISQTINNDYSQNPLFIYEEKGSSTQQIIKRDICSIFKQLYSYDNICHYIDKVNKEMSINNAIHFVGDKIGVKDFELHKGKLQLSIYKTDHFTWQVFKEVFKENKSFFQEIMLRVNRGNLLEKRVLVRCLAFLFSSFGIDIILESTNCLNERNLIISARSRRIEKNRVSSLHVSVNETFSRTDNVGSSESNYDLKLCVKRGIQEEIGIPEECITDDIIKFHDFAIVTDEGEIGLSCYVNLTNKIPIEQILMYPGQDKFLENEELLVMPYLKMNHIDLVQSMSSDNYRRQFYKQTYNDRFNMPWMSFTPLLVSRVLIRNISYGVCYQLIFFFLYWFVLYCIFPGISISNQILGEATTVVVTILINYCASRFKRNEYPYKFIQPTVSQWYGNAKVIQSTGFADSSDVGNGITLIASRSLFENNQTLISDLRLKSRPKCEVRIKKSDNVYSERPVSFFQFESIGGKDDSKKLKFRALNVSCDDLRTQISIKFYYEKDDIRQKRTIKRISFADDIDFSVKQCVESRCLSDDMVNIKLPQQIIEKYDLIDLFEYKDNFYWSMSPHLTKQVSKVYTIDNKKSKGNIVKNDLYNDICDQLESIKDDKGCIEVSVVGSNHLLEYWINKFVNHPENKRRISELERYMLQLYFIRHKIVFADCKYSKRVKYKLYSN